ncbi:hypothetical protein MAHJHV35_46630 [Mycobacterium avium subsp. hominissuis]
MPAASSAGAGSASATLQLRTPAAACRVRSFSLVLVAPARRQAVTSELRVDTTSRPARVLQDDLTNSYSLVTA